MKRMILLLLCILLLLSAIAVYYKFYAPFSSPDMDAQPVSPPVLTMAPNELDNDPPSSTLTQSATAVEATPDSGSEAGAPPAAEVPPDTVQPTERRSGETTAFEPAPVTEPADDSLIAQPVIFESGGLTVFAESLVRSGSGLEFTISLRNDGTEDVTWTMASIDVDILSLPVGAPCDVPAGQTMLYTYTLDNPMVGILLRTGSHSVSIRSVLTDAAGQVIAEGTSDSVTIAAD